MYCPNASPLENFLHLIVPSIIQSSQYVVIKIMKHVLKFLIFSINFVTKFNTINIFTH